MPIESAMTAMGHLQTFVEPERMSALPPEADIRVAHTAALLKRLVQDAPRRLQAAALLALGRPG